MVVFFASVICQIHYYSKKKLQNQLFSAIALTANKNVAMTLIIANVCNLCPVRVFNFMIH